MIKKMETTTYNPFGMPPEEIAEKAMTLYRERLQASLDTDENKGKILSIDIKSGDYVLGEKLHEPARALRRTHPDAIIFTLKIGYRAVYQMGYRLRTCTETE